MSKEEIKKILGDYVDSLNLAYDIGFEVYDLSPDGFRIIHLKEFSCELEETIDMKILGATMLLNAFREKLIPILISMYEGKIDELRTSKTQNS